MPEEVLTCPLCQKSQRTSFDQREFRGYRIENDICTNCGLVYQSPQMTDEELQAFYEHDYRQVYQGSEDPIQKDLIVQVKRADWLSNFLLETAITPVNRYLDIGSSSGVLLEKISADFGCKSIGIEPGEAYRAYAQERNLLIYASIEELEKAEESDFDLISLVHVLEHLSDPIGYLRNIKIKHLKPEGFLLIEVPNLYAHDCFEIAHLVSFSASTLRQVVEQAGFRVRYLIKHGHPRSKLIPLYLTLLAEAGVRSSTPPIKVESGVRLKRRAGLLHRRILSKLFPRQAWINLGD